MSRELPKAARVAKNGDIKCFLDITPTADSSTWADLRENFEENGFNMNEVIQKIAFLVDSGWESSWVSGASLENTYTGKYIKNDPLCEFLRDVEHEIGEKRVTNYRVSKFGKGFEGSCTITKLAIGGGKGTDGAPIAMTIAFNGKPTLWTDTSSGTTSSTETNTDETNSGDEATA